MKSITVHNRCRIDLIAEPYLPIIEAAIQVYKELLGNNLINVRIMGSVPRGKSHFAQSDIDFIAICKNNLTENEMEALRQTSAYLSHLYTSVISVDLEWEVNGAVNPSREFIFITDSLSIHGLDIYPQKEMEILSIDLARITTPDIDGLIRSYGNELTESPSPERIRLISRWTGKDFLKCFRRHLTRISHKWVQKSLSLWYNCFTTNKIIQKRKAKRCKQTVFHPYSTFKTSERKRSSATSMAAQSAQMQARSSSGSLNMPRDS